MPMGIGIGLSITRGEGGGPWLATKAAVLAAATLGAVPVTMSSPPTVSVGADGVSTITGSNISLVEDPATRRTFGGRFAKLDFPGTNWGVWTSVHLNGTDDSQLGGGIEFVTNVNTQDFEVIVSGTAGYGFRVWSDGQLVSRLPFVVPSSSGEFYFKFSFSGAATRTIRVEFMGGITWKGIKTPTGQPITAPATATPLKMVVAGDSFPEGTGAKIRGLPQFGLLGLGNFMGQCLGLKNVFISGSGGTGYAKTNGSRVNLLDRYLLDIVAEAPEIVVLMMGINDDDATAALANATTIIDGIHAALPATLIYVIGPWNPSAPTPISGIPATIRTGLAAICAGRGYAKFSDPDLVPYALAGGGDTTHPSYVGHETLGLWEANEIRADLGLSALAAIRGPELCVNGDFASATGWTDSSSGTGTAVISGGVLTITRADASNKGNRNRSITTVNGVQYEVLYGRNSGNSFSSFAAGGANFGGRLNPQYFGTASGTSTTLTFECPTNGGTLVMDDASVRAVL
jgi:lysophospholipase L1-like esterase